MHAGPVSGYDCVVNARQKLKILSEAVRKVLPDLSEYPHNSTSVEALCKALDTISDKCDGTFVFVTTHNVFRYLNRIVNERDSPELRLIRREMERSRLTQRRVFVTLPIDHAAMRALKDLLMAARASSAPNMIKALSRLVKQIDREVLSCSPLRLLAQSAL